MKKILFSLLWIGFTFSAHAAHMFHGSPIDEHLFNAQDPTGLNLPFVKADQAARPAKHESNSFSFVVVAYAQSLKELAAQRMGKLQQKGVKVNSPAPNSPQALKEQALSIGIASQKKAMKEAGLSDKQISAIPPLDDPKWGR